MKSYFTIRIRTIAIVFSLLSFALVNAQTLPTVTSVTSPTTRNLYSVYLTSPTNGIAVGDSVILHYNGSAWSTVSIPVNGRLEGVHFPTATTGYIVGVDRSGSSKTYVLQTTNGGTSWTNVAPDTLFTNLHSVFFTSADTGFAVGEGVILKTVSGGTLWSSLADTTFSFRSIYFSQPLNHPDTGFVVGDDAVMLVNGGSPSYLTPQDLNGPLLSVYFASPDTGYICGTGGQLLRISEASPTSATSISFGTGNLYSTYFLNGKSGFVTSSGVFYTADAGTSWDSLATPTKDTLRSINFPKGSTTGFAVGDAGTIVKINAPASVTGVSPVIAATAVTVYPNPSYGSFTVQASGNYHLNVLNAVGQQIYSQMVTDAFTINLPNAAPGMYYVQVISGSATSVEKMIIK